MSLVGFRCTVLTSYLVLGKWLSKTEAWNSARSHKILWYRYVQYSLCKRARKIPLGITSLKRSKDFILNSILLLTLNELSPSKNCFCRSQIQLLQLRVSTLASLRLLFHQEATQNLSFCFLMSGHVSVLFYFLNTSKSIC